MKKVLSLFIVLLLILSPVLSVSAANGKVVYSGDSGSFIFEPGSDKSPTDLFPNFKSVMPGDVLKQDITVRNDASNKVKVKIYLRSLGADANSVDFLSKLNLRVEKSENNQYPYMFDAAASETTQLTDWVLLGTLYSGGEVNIRAILDVPTELSNDYQDNIGLIDWEFMVEELPIEPDDPDIPSTGVDSNIMLVVTIAASACVLMIIMMFMKKKSKKAKN